MRHGFLKTFQVSQGRMECSENDVDSIRLFTCWRLRTRAEDRLKRLVAGDLRLGLAGEESDLPRSSTYDVETEEAVETIFTRGDARSWRLPEEMGDRDDDI